jgi:hypothetical protein
MMMPEDVAALAEPVDPAAEVVEGAVGFDEELHDATRIDRAAVPAMRG